MVKHNNGTCPFDGLVVVMAWECIWMTVAELLLSWFDWKRPIWSCEFDDSLTTLTVTSHGCNDENRRTVDVLHV
jgi:hypothetical protein